MKHYIIRYLMFSFICFAQEVTFTEKFDDGGLKSITYFKKIGNKFILDKEEKFYEDGSLWYSCELKRIFDQKEWKYVQVKHGNFLSFHSNGGEKEKGIYNEDRKDGKWVSWYGNGYKMKEEIYKDGTLISKKTWNDDGSLNR